MADAWSIRSDSTTAAPDAVAPATAEDEDEPVSVRVEHMQGAIRALERQAEVVSQQHQQHVMQLQQHGAQLQALRGARGPDAGHSMRFDGTDVSGTGNSFHNIYYYIEHVEHYHAASGQTPTPSMASTGQHGETHREASKRSRTE